MQAPRRHVGFEFCDPLRGCAPDASGQFAYGKAEDAGAALVSEREIERLQHFRFESEPVILRIQAKELCVRPFVLVNAISNPERAACSGLRPE